MTNVVRLAPNISASSLNEEDISIQRLGSLLEAAVIDHEFGDQDDIYASDGLELPAWITIDPDRKLIVCFTYIEFEDPVSLLERVNEMNRTITSVQFHADASRVWGQYVLTYESGLNTRQFIKMLRCFSGAFKAGISLEAEKAAKELKIDADVHNVH